MYARRWYYDHGNTRACVCQKHVITASSIHYTKLYEKPSYDGLMVDPCIPNEWKEYKVTRKFRNKTYNITILNPYGVSKGLESMLLNGVKVNGNIIPEGT